MRTSVLLLSAAAILSMLDFRWIVQQTVTVNRVVLDKQCLDGRDNDERQKNGLMDVSVSNDLDRKRLYSEFVT